MLINSLEQLVDGGCKCFPKTPVPWINASDKHLVEGAPALNDKSQLPCFFGGVIEIVSIEDQQAEDGTGPEGRAGSSRGAVSDENFKNDRSNVAGNRDCLCFHQYPLPEAFLYFSETSNRGTVKNG